MIYLTECQAGCDSSAIGFPHVLLCMAVVLQTRKRLYGFHFDTPALTNEFAGALLSFITRKHGKVKNGVRLYGCCHHHIRNYNRKPRASDEHAAWRAEMQQIAAKLDYHGRVSGFDTSILHPRDGTYIEFHREEATNRCRIYYKRHAKVAHGTVEDRAPAETGDVNTWQTSPELAGTWRSNVTRKISADLKPTATKWHELNYFLRQTTFQVP